jgi:hypothetical protein
MKLARISPIVAFAIGTVVLAACASHPITADVDVRAQMPETSGTTEFELEVGEEQDVDVLLPTSTGECVDLSAAGIDVTVHRAQLHWNVDVTYDGPPMTGMLQARLYVAGAQDDLFAAQHSLGPVVTVKLDRTTTRFAGTAVLSPAQLRAVNDGVICWGVDVRGRDVSVEEGGTATIEYEINDLWMRLDFSVL